MPIFNMNWNRSVQRTPHNPPSETYIPVKGIRKKTQTASAWPFVPENAAPQIWLSQFTKPVKAGQPCIVGPMVVPTMLIMAFVTQPRIKQFINRPRYIARNPRRNAAGLPAYRISANCTSVISPERRHNFANRKTVIIPESKNAHQIQFPAIPCVYTSPATSSGVSAENVVATIDVPASHHDTLRPETK